MKFGWGFEAEITPARLGKARNRLGNRIWVKGTMIFLEEPASSTTGQRAIRE